MTSPIVSSLANGITARGDKPPVDFWGRARAVFSSSTLTSPQVQALREGGWQGVGGWEDIGTFILCGRVGDSVQLGSWQVENVT